MPVAFVGHGNPLNFVMEDRYEGWVTWAGSLPRPTGILTVSAHWEDAPATIGRTLNHHELLYDFYGFPDFMYEVSWPAPGAPGLADRLEALLGPHLPLVRADRLLDHGAWVPLARMFPEADIPVLQLSMPMTMVETDLLALGAELSPLRDEGVLILATGNAVHDLRNAVFTGDVKPPGYAVGFDNWVQARLEQRDDTALADWMNAAPDALRAHPSAEHFRPLVVAAGAAGASPARFPLTGFEHGTISRRCVQFG
jgi:4,5-DOPA dioxygenase extradiol